MKIRKFLSAALCGVIAVSALAGCDSKGEPEATEKPALNVVTGDAEIVLDTNAYLSGHADGYGEEMPDAVGIYLGTSEDDMKVVIRDSNPSNKYVSKSVDVTYDLNLEAEEYLTPDTVYYYMFYVSTGGEQQKGEIKSFKTVPSSDVPEADVTVETGRADNITDIDAQLYAHISNFSEQVEEAAMFLGKSEDDLKKIAADKNPYSQYDKSEYDVWYGTKSDAKLTLEPETTYYYQAYVRIGNAVKRGEIKSFTTAAATAE